MKLFLLTPKDEDPFTNGVWKWSPWYDKMFAIVVRAQDERQARSIAMDNSADEGRDAWTSKYSDCVEVTPEGDSGVIIKQEHWA